MRKKINYNKIIFKIILYLVFLNSTSCQLQTTKFIDKNVVIDKQYIDEDKYLFKSNILDKLFDKKELIYVISDYVGTVLDNYYILPIDIYENNKSYILLFDNNNILKDTLSFNSNYSYSLNVQLENKKEGICLGKFDEENTFFGIEKIYEISDKIKLIPLSINTKILNCPIPIQYLSEENVGMEDYFKYGINRKILSKKIIPKDISSQWWGKYNKRVETEMTTTGMASITYNFIVTKNKILLKINTYHEPISCDGEYYAIENGNILELYYNENDSICKSETPNFIIKKQNGKYYIKGLGGEGTINEWVGVKKEK